VEGACLDAFAHAEAGQTSPQLARRFSSEGQSQRVPSIGLLGGDPPSDTSGEHSGLAGTGTGDHRNQM
jgi:hypothetical protein